MRAHGVNSREPNPMQQMPAQVPQPDRLLAAHRDIETVQAGQGTEGVEVRMESEGGEVKKEIEISIEDLLALIYIRDVHCAAIIGKVCDEELDKSGALLGRVRECARIMRINNVPSRLGIDGQEEVRGFNEAAYK